MMSWFRPVIVTMAVVVTTAAGAQTWSATASEVEAAPTSEIDAALAEVDAPEAGTNDAVDLPNEAEDALTFDDGGLELSLNLPASGSADVDGLRRTFTGDGVDNAISVEPLTGGMRALISISSPDAPREYPFALEGDVTSLKLESDGSVTAYRGETPVAHVATPWAVDAAGAQVPTWFEVDGTSLVQVVDHRSGDFEYGITADPSLWKITKCVAAITVAIGSAVISVSKILKIKKIVSAAGGVTKAAKRVIKALGTRGSLSEKAKAGFKDLGVAVVAAAVVVLDIDQIQDQCG